MFNRRNNETLNKDAYSIRKDMKGVKTHSRHSTIDKLVNYFLLPCLAT